MDNSIASIQKRVNPVLYEAQRLGYAARASELQLQTAGLLQNLKGEVSRLKSEFISEQDEYGANALLSMELILDAFAAELLMWVAIKEDRMGEAWDRLVDAQSALNNALQAHEAATVFSDYDQKLTLAERILFPTQKFLSMGMIVNKSVCSVCGQDYDACDHIKGRAYMGRLCSRVIKQFDVEEVSIVDEPANRHCRIVSITDSGVARDCLTWREVKRPEPDSTENG